MATTLHMVQGASLAKRPAAGKVDLARGHSNPPFAGVDKRLVVGLLTAGDPCWRRGGLQALLVVCAAVRRWVIRLEILSALSPYDDYPQCCDFKATRK